MDTTAVLVRASFFSVLGTKQIFFFFFLSHFRTYQDLNVIPNLDTDEHHLSHEGARHEVTSMSLLNRGDLPHMAELGYLGPVLTSQILN